MSIATSHPAMIWTPTRLVNSVTPEHNDYARLLLHVLRHLACADDGNIGTIHQSYIPIASHINTCYYRSQQRRKPGSHIRQMTYTWDDSISIRLPLVMVP